jgi:hypothetical protein
MWKCVCLPDVEVLDIDVLVGSRLPLAPQQKTLLRRGLCRQRGMEERKEREKGGGRSRREKTARGRKKRSVGRIEGGGKQRGTKITKNEKTLQHVLSLLQEDMTSATEFI